MTGATPSLIIPSGTLLNPFLRVLWMLSKSHHNAAALQIDHAFAFLLLNAEENTHIKAKYAT